MKDYEGICAICFEPIEEGKGTQIIKEGRRYHESCTHEQPNNYYVKLEQMKVKFLNTDKKEIHKLMAEMEKFFSIPLLNDNTYNQENGEVIKLYREMSNARDL